MKVVMLFFCCYSFVAYSQQKYKYLVLLKDKTNSPYSISQPLQYLSQKYIDRRFKQGIPINASDLPPNPNYITQIQQIGATIIYRSRGL